MPEEAPEDDVVLGDVVLVVDDVVLPSVPSLPSLGVDDVVTGREVVVFALEAFGSGWIVDEALPE